MLSRSLLFAIALAIGLPIAACAPPPLEPRAPTPGAPSLRIATYNLNLDLSDDRETLEAIGATRADVVALQEVTPEWAAAIVAEYENEYPHRLFHEVVGAGGLGMLSKYPLTDLGVVPGFEGWHPSWHLLADTPLGEIQVINVHLRPEVSAREGYVEEYLTADEDHLAEIQYITEACDEDAPTVVLGDFNESPDGEAIELLESRGFENALPLFHPGQETWRKSSYLGQAVSTIDHVMIGEELRVLNAFVVDAGNSDHLPVVAIFEPAQP